MQVHICYKTELLEMVKEIRRKTKWFAMSSCLRTARDFLRGKFIVWLSSQQSFLFPHDNREDQKSIKISSASAEYNLISRNKLGSSSRLKLWWNSDEILMKDYLRLVVVIMNWGFAIVNRSDFHKTYDCLSSNWHTFFLSAPAYGWLRLLL